MSFANSIVRSTISRVAIRFGAAWFALMALGAVVPAEAAALRALLIANGNYPAPDTHSSVPGKNAGSLAAELRHAGFGVDLHENLGRDRMRGVVLAFTKTLERGDRVLLFFSGYGIQVEGSTYLIPVDADIWTASDVQARAIALSEITNAFADAGTETQFVVLDASRRNPFERRFRTLSTGLGPIDMPAGSLLISAAGVGEVFADGDGETSLFISELVKEMRAPDLTVQEIFERTRIGVARATKGAQRPFVLSSLAGNVYLGPSKGAPVPDTPVSMPSPGAGMPSGQPTPGLVFRDCELCPDVVVIGAGAFAMGSDDFETEKPVHRAVVARPFAIGRSEVTFAQWDACIADGGCTYRPSDERRGRTTLPVGALSWRDAIGYVDWLTRTSGHAYRLPTEAEWEYAARAGTTTDFWWGDEVRVGFANCRGCGGDGGRETLAVGSYQANPFGLVDTAGNVAEWVSDCWTESYRRDPSDAATRAAGACKQRVVRGGSYDSGPRYVRSSSRFPYDPDLRYYANGVRVLRELP
jgi:formylglycine-generating enzyme required for sulfatase activity